MLLVATTSLYGQHTYDIADSTDQHIFVYDFIEYLEDPKDSITLKNILDGHHDHTFKPNTDFAPKNYNIHSAYWVRIKINHHSNSQKQWLLEFFDQTIDSIFAFIPKPNNRYDTILLGDAAPFSMRRIKHKNFIIPIENDHNKELTYYFKVKASHPIDIILVVRSYDFFSFYSLNEYFLFGIFYGLIILIGLYNLLLYFTIRETPYLHFVLYTYSVALFFSSSDGFSYQYLWSHWPFWNEIAYGVFMFFISVFGIFFTKHFLHLKYKAPKLNTILNGVLALRSIYFFSCLFFDKTWFDHLYIDIVPLVFVLAISAYFLWRGYKPARLATLAFFFLLIGSITKLLLATGIGNIGSGVINYYALNMAFLLQLIALSFALGDKVRILKNKKDRAMRRIVKQHEINSRLQTKVNRELEQRVKERTLELNIKNEELKKTHDQMAEQAAEINKMNAMLDIDNWKIKKESKQEIRKKLLSRGVNYTEFIKIFPDDMICYQYLADVKWSQGFECKKCGHTNGNQQKHHSRRCSRCGYIESATSHTVFHNVKFPLQKAFYISHLELTGTKITTVELSRILKLRVATCSAFREKLRKALSGNDHKETLKNQDIIVFFDY